MPTWVYTVVCKCLQWSVCELKCTLVNSTVNLCKMKNHVLVISSNSHLHISVLLKGSNAYKRKRNLRNVSLSSLEMKTLTEYLPSQYCFTLTTLAVNGREVSQKTSAASLHVPGSLGNQILRLCVLPWRAVSLQPPLGAVNAQVSLKDACWCSHCRPLKARPTAHSAHPCRVWWEEPVCPAAQEVPKSRPHPSEQTYPDRHTTVAPGTKGTDATDSAQLHRQIPLSSPESRSRSGASEWVSPGSLQTG